MSFQLNVAPSQMAKLAKKAEGEEEGPQRKNREDYKKLKELEEMRKAGSAPAMKDEEGKDINPHIPQYIMQAPWYYNADQATLRHQRVQPQDVKAFSKKSGWCKRGVKAHAKIATKFRKGMCENCGAMTHTKVDCLERPRKVTAKCSGTHFAPDEYIQPQLDSDFEGKRDRWNGYDLEDHKRIVEEYQKIEKAKKLLKAQKFDKDLAAAGSQEPDAKDDNADSEDDKYTEDVLMPGQKFEIKQRITVRNLRIREDTAKYLYNLNTNSAHYDPKTRSMRGNPFEGSGKTIFDVPYAGDNFVRCSGDAMDMAKKHLFAWEASGKGGDVHLQADPTKLEILAKEFSKRKDEVKTKAKDSILDKYGGQEHLEAPPKQLLMAQSEDYLEYSRHGTVMKGQEKAKVKSRYEEDVYFNNHTSVWGSYWKDGQWGLKCCHSLIKESYCTGEAGKEASFTTEEPKETLAIEDALQEKSESEEKAPKKSSLKKTKNKSKKRKKSKKIKKRDSSSDSSSGSEESEDEDAEREKGIQEAMDREKLRVADVDRLLGMDERKRPYNSMMNIAEPTEEEMEAFSRKRIRSDDPMAAFL